MLGRADKDVKYSFVSVLKFIDAYKQSPPYQRQQAMLSAPPEVNPEAPDPLVRAQTALAMRYRRKSDTTAATQGVHTARDLVAPRNLTQVTAGIMS